MLKNYFKIAWRNLRKHKFYTFLNVFGLSLGLASVLLITLYVVDELDYDKSFENYDRIYRVHADIKFGGADMKLAVTPDPLAFTMKNDYPQIEAVTRLRSTGSALVKRPNTIDNLKEPQVSFADSTFFKVFSIPFVSGNKLTALNEPNTLILSESNVFKYFGKEDPVGKTLVIDNHDTYTVTGVFQDIPAHSHLADLKIILSMSTYEDSRSGSWGSHNYLTYLLMSRGVDAARFEKNFDTVIEKYTGKWIQSVLGSTLNEIRKSGNYIKYSLMPLADIHLHSDRSAELSANSNIEYVYIFSIVALFLLAIACVNFMNLATARSANRAKEVGVRKALGSDRYLLVGQFLTESVLLSFISLFTGIVLAYLALPLFNDLANKHIEFPFEKGIFWVLVVIVGLVVGMLAGSYPAFYLSSFNPLKVLKGTLVTSRSGTTLRNALVVFQFIISVMLIVSTAVIYKQLNYIQSKKLGFDKNHVLIIDDAYSLRNQTNAFKQEVSKLPNVEISTVSSFLPTPSSRSDNTYFPEGQVQQDKGINMQSWEVDEDFIKTLTLEMKEGRGFLKNYPSDSTGVVINETAAKILGFKNPIGKKIFSFEDVNNQNRVNYTIIGVVHNFHFESLRNNIGALGLLLRPSGGAIAIKLKPGDPERVLAQVEKIWKAMAPGQPFGYHFMDQDFDNVYRSERRVGQIFVTFAIISILIGCLGLFGLSAFTAERRTKEIGVRKVLGANVFGIVGLLSKEFIKLVLISIVIGSPIAWYAMNTWLAGFVYHIAIAWWMFLSAGCLAIFIALITVSFQSVKAALQNPVRSLRSE